MSVVEKVQRRKYRLKRRAERQAETRSRIVDAAIELHSTVGPARTSISAVAERAGVQRHTVYAHFPDELSLFRGCSTRWAELDPQPDPGPWRRIADPEERLRQGLRAVYAYYAENESLLANVMRDLESSAVLREVSAPLVEGIAKIGEVLTAGFRARNRRRERIRSAVELALDFHTWRLLARRLDLSSEEAAEFMVTLLRGASR